MAEATSTTAAATLAATASAYVLALLGIDYYALVGALVGVLLTLSSVRPAGLVAVVTTVAVTTLAAAAAGQGVAELLGVTKRPLVILCALALGALGQVGLQGIAHAAGEALGERLKQILGGRTP